MNFLGPDKIEKVEELDNGMVLVHLSDERKEELPKEMFAATASEEASDYTTLVNNRGNIVVEDIMAVFLKHNVKASEVNLFIRKLENSVNMVLSTADSILWGKDREDKTFLDIDRVIKSKKVTLDDIKKSE